MIDRVSRELPSGRRLVVNAGNIFDSRSPVLKIESAAVMKMLAACGVEVLGVGPDDVAVWASLGDDAWWKLVNDSPINVVSANIAGFLPYVRLQKNGMRILVTSVLDPFKLKQLDLTPPREVSDPVNALHRVLSLVRYDLAIVIIHSTKGRIESLARQFPTVDLVIDGCNFGIRDNFKDIKKGRDKLIVRNNKQGQWLCYLDLFPVKKSRSLNLSQPVCLKIASKKVKPDPGVEKLADEYFRQRREFFRALEEARRRKRMAAMKPNMYLGTRSCDGCHQAAGKVWRKSHHARAFAVLQKKQRENDPECLPCHVTGMRDSSAVGGFQSYTESPQMVNVQCEACHGPGAGHAQNPSRNRLRPHPESSCLKCHDQDNDPSFSYEEKWPLIRHR